MKTLTKGLFAALVTAALPSALSAATLGTYTQTLPTTNTTLFTGVSLKDVRSVSAKFNSDNMDTSDQKATATPWHVERFKDESDVTTNMTIQFQASLGDYTKCVVVSLWQSGDNIMGKAVEGRYYATRFVYREGYDAYGTGWTEPSTSYTIGELTISDEDDECLRKELWWNGGATGTWDSTSRNWLDANGEESEWITGARASFTNASVATVTVAAGGVTASHLRMQGRAVTFTGGTLTMVSSAEVEMRCGKVRFECPISSTDGFRVLNAMVSTGTVSQSSHSTAQQYFDGVVIADVTGAIAHPEGNGSSYGKSTPPRAYNLKPSDDGNTLGAQLQWFAGDWTKCVIIEMKQDGEKATVRWKNGFYYYNNNVNGVDARGYDFETDNDNKVSSYSYRIQRLCLDARVELAGTNVISGLIRADNGTTLALDRGTINGGLCSNVIVIADAILEVAHTRQRFAGKIDSLENRKFGSSDHPRIHGGLVVKGNVDDETKDVLLNYPSALPTKSDPGPMTVFNNASLSGFVAASANFSSKNMGGKYPWPATPFFFYNDGEKVQIQFHRIDGSGSNVYAK